MALTITDGTTPVVFADAPDGFTSTVGKYWTRLPIKGERYGVEKHKGPATSGKVVKRHDFDGRDLGPFLVWYINTTTQLIWTAYDADFAAIKNKGLTITIPNYKVFPSLVCSMGRFDPLSYPKASGTALFRMACFLEFTQDRAS